MAGIFDLLAGGLIGKLGDLAKIFIGSKSERDAAIGEEVKAVQEAYMAELNAPEKIGWWGSFIDGLNRLVRPFFTFGSVALLVWPTIDPVQFQIAMTAVATIPEPLWYLVYTVVGFWFGGRLLDRAPTKIKPMSPADVAALLVVQKKLASLDDPKVEAAVVEPVIPASLDHPPAPKPVVVDKKKVWEGRKE